MADEFDVTGGDDAGTPPFDLDGSAWGQPPADDAGQPATSKAEPAEPEPTVEAALERAYDEKVGGTDDAKSEAAWQREMRRMSDETLRGAGVPPERRGELGVSRREVVRRLHAAEAMLRQDLGQGLSAIVKGYGGTLAPEQRGAAARAVLNAFGFQTPAAIGDHERARLAEFDRQQQERQAAEQAMLPRIRSEFEAFRASHADFEQLRQTMAGLIHSGAARGLQDSYALARKAHGIEDAAALAADEARRSKVASARAAGTPQTKSAPGQRNDRAGPAKDTGALLEDAWDSLMGAA